MTVVAQRGDSILIADGPAAAIWRAGRVLRVTHREAALARGYWDDYTAPLPDGLPDDLAARLAILREQIEATDR